MPIPATENLPNPHGIVQQLLRSLATAAPSRNDLQPNLTPAKPQLLTLHALFPTTFLGALDLLDRNLVSRVTIDDKLSTDQGDVPVDASVQDEETSRISNVSHVEDSADAAAVNIGVSDSPKVASSLKPVDSRAVIYYVQSQQYQARGRRSTSRVESHSYEVRLQAWNCTCAAFAFAAFNTTDEFVMEYVDDDDSQHEHLDLNTRLIDESGQREPSAEITWGGLANNGEQIPMCKHLLACVLCEYWDVAAEKVEQRTVARGEMAGLAAGWGFAGSIRG